MFEITVNTYSAEHTHTHTHCMAHQKTTFDTVFFSVLDNVASNMFPSENYGCGVCVQPFSFLKVFQVYSEFASVVLPPQNICFHCCLIHCGRIVQKCPSHSDLNPSELCFRVFCFHNHLSLLSHSENRAFVYVLFKTSSWLLKSAAFSYVSTIIFCILSPTISPVECTLPHLFLTLLHPPSFSCSPSSFLPSPLPC